MRGYFGVGLENLSKPHNAGALYRTAHAFGASFLFAFGTCLPQAALSQVDTSKVGRHVPFTRYDCFEDFVMPEDCTLVGVEISPQAELLESFSHPERAVYLFGPESGSLSPHILERCGHVVRIPTKFCLNVGIAAAIVLYDRRLDKVQKC